MVDGAECAIGPRKDRSSTQTSRRSRDKWFIHLCPAEYPVCCRRSRTTPSPNGTKRVLRQRLRLQRSRIEHLRTKFRYENVDGGIGKNPAAREQGDITTVFHFGDRADILSAGHSRAK